MQMTSERLPRQRSGTMVVTVAVALGFLSLFIAGLYPLITARGPSQQEPAQRSQVAVEQPAGPDGRAQADQPAPEEVQPLLANGPLAQDVAALVNGQAIRAEDLRLAAQVDQAMARLLGRAAEADSQAQLTQAINQALVLQAADQARFTVSPERSQALLDDFLASNGLSQSALRAALADQGISWDRFQAFFQRLLQVEGFLLAESQARGVPREQILAELQAQARISYGPARTWDTPVPEEAEPESPEEATSSAPSLDTAQATGTAPAGTEKLEIALAPAEAAQASEATGVTEVTEAAEPRGTGVGELAPAFTLPTVNTAEETLSLDDLQGQPVLLSFWTTWCPFCRRQAPVLVNAYARYADQGVAFVGVNVKEGRAPVENYLEQEGMTYPVVLDQSGTTAQAYQVRGFPTTYFLDREGRVVARHVGQLTPEQVTGYLDRLLDASAP